MSAERNPAPNLVAMARENLGLLIAGASFFIVVLRLLSVSRWNLDTARVVLAEQGTSQVLVGAVLVVWPVLLMTPVVVYIGTRTRDNLPHRTTFGLVSAGLIIFIFPAAFAFIVLLSLSAGFATGLATSALMNRGVTPDRSITERARRKAKTRSQMTTVTTIFLVAVLGLGSTAANMWLPTERIRVASVSEPIVGFVLSEDEEQILLLEESDRRVLKLQMSAIQSREYCALKGENNTPALLVRGTYTPLFALLIFDGTRYPRC